MKVEKITPSGTMRVIRAPRVMYVQEATFIPSGMHGVDIGQQKNVTESVSKQLVAKGVPEHRARRMVKMASIRIRSRYWRGNRGAAGLGDGGETSASPLEAVQTKATAFQNAHRTLIAQLAGAVSDIDRLTLRNTIESLYNDWTQYAVQTKDGAPPFEWNRVDPVDAILIAVRDDLRNTVDLIDANKAQQVLGKQIKSYGGGFSLPKLEIPWYVWAGGAAAGLLMLSSALK